MRCQAIAVSIVLAACAAAAAALVPGLLKPEVRQEVERLQDAPQDQRASAQRRLAEITEIQSDFMRWRTAADKDLSKARSEWREKGSAGQSREAERFGRVMDEKAVGELVDDLASTAGGADGEEDDGWVDALLDYLERTNPKKRG